MLQQLPKTQTSYPIMKRMYSTQRSCLLLLVAIGACFAFWAVHCFAGPETANAQDRVADELVHRGHDLVVQGEKEKAIECFSQALRLDPQHVWAYHYRGHALYRLQKTTEAIHDLTKCIDLGHKPAEVYMFRGYAWGWEGKYEKAIADLSEAIRLSEHRYPKIWAYAARGEYLVALRRNDEAIADLSVVIALDPKGEETHEAYFDRAIAWMRSGYCEKAIADFDKAILYDQNASHAKRYREKLRQKLSDNGGDNAQQSEDIFVISQDGVVADSNLPAGRD